LGNYNRRLLSRASLKINANKSPMNIAARALLKITANKLPPKEYALLKKCR
jgi:hypothetical protein